MQRESEVVVGHSLLENGGWGGGSGACPSAPERLHRLGQHQVGRADTRGEMELRAYKVLSAILIF